MVDEQDWKAAMSSEIFREYVNNELKKEAAKEAEDTRLIRTHLAEQIRKQAEAEKAHEAEVLSQNAALSAFDDFEMKVKANPALLAKFKQIKQALISNPGLIEKVDPKFVQGIMMLDTETE